MPYLKKISRALGFFSLVFACAFFVSATLNQVTFPVADEPASLYANQIRDDLRLCYRSAIREAKYTITLFIYTLTDPGVIKDLRERAEDRVSVVVYCDAKEAEGLEEKLGKEVTLIKRFKSSLMHQKILVIDGHQVWIGSANMTPESLRMHGNLVAGVESEELSQFLESRLVDKKEGYKSFKLGGQTVELSLSPQDKQAVDRLKELIRGAKKSIRVAMYTFTRQDLAEEIVEASKRGVDVEVVLDAKSAGGVSEQIARFFRNQHIPFGTSTKEGLLHHKFLYIDGKILVNGSANWTKAAFTQNEDCFMIFHNLRSNQRKVMESLWKVIRLESTLSKK